MANVIRQCPNYMITIAISVLTLALVALASFRRAAFNREVRERLHALERRAADADERDAATRRYLDGKIDTLATDWTSAFGNVQRDWTKHISEVADRVTTDLSYQKQQPRPRR